MPESCFYRILIIVLFVCCGCQHTNKKDPDNVSRKDTSTEEIKRTVQQPDAALPLKNPDFELKVDSIFPSSLKKIPITILNHTDRKLAFGSDYKLEYYCDSLSEWQNALPPHTAYTMDLHIVEPKSSYNMTIYMYDNKPGKYKVTKTGKFFHESNDETIKSSLLEEIILTGEFLLSSSK